MDRPAGRRFCAVVAGTLIAGYREASPTVSGPQGQAHVIVAWRAFSRASPVSMPHLYTCTLYLEPPFAPPRNLSAAEMRVQLQTITSCGDEGQEMGRAEDLSGAPTPCRNCRSSP